MVGAILCKGPSKRGSFLEEVSLKNMSSVKLYLCFGKLMQDCLEIQLQMYHKPWKGLPNIVKPV